jgi:hypothetical protein
MTKDLGAAAITLSFAPTDRERRNGGMPAGAAQDEQM